MIFEGVITKMKTELGDPVQYYLVNEIESNSLNI